MQQFTVPQFIDVESKIIGPLTTRQFLIFLAYSVIDFLAYKLFDFTLFLTIAILAFVIAGAFAFFKVNGRPFHFFVLNFVQTNKKPKLRVWNHRYFSSDDRQEMTIKFPEEQVSKEMFARSRLAELVLIVDTSGQYKGESGETDISTGEDLFDK